MYLCIIYGIVMIEIDNNNNKELYTCKVTYPFLIYHLSLQRLENPKMSIVYVVHPYTYDTLPLDNSKTYSHPSLLYIT